MQLLIHNLWKRGDLILKLGFSFVQPTVACTVKCFQNTNQKSQFKGLKTLFLQRPSFLNMPAPQNGYRI